jgi:hypothetical protein
MKGDITSTANFHVDTIIDSDSGTSVSASSVIPPNAEVMNRRLSPFPPNVQLVGLWSRMIDPEGLAARYAARLDRRQRIQCELGPISYCG